jgi:hypothetical protein
LIDIAMNDTPKKQESDKSESAPEELLFERGNLSIANRKKATDLFHELMAARDQAQGNKA